MGQLRFLVPCSQRVTDAVLQRAYLEGLDHVPWVTATHWDGQVLTVERDVRESGSLAIPWPVPSFGEFILTTTSLMERKAPYDLALELARGTLHRLRNQLLQWKLAGFNASPVLQRSVDEAQEAFLRAATRQSQPEVVLRESDSCLEACFVAMDRACSEFAQTTIELRTSTGSQLATLLGAAVESPPLDARATKWTLASFNTIQLSMCWSDIEQTPGVRGYTAIENQLRWCREQGLKTIAGPLFRPNRRCWPAWLDPRSTDFDTLQRQVSDFTLQTVRQLQGKVHVWHAASAIMGDNESRLSEEQRLRLLATVIESVRHSDSRTPLVVSFDQPWGEYMARRHYDLSPLHLADMLVRSDLGIAGLGLEINFGYLQRGSWPRDLLEINRLIDHWSALGLPLLLFLTAPSGLSGDPQATEPTGVIEQLGSTGPTAEWQKQFVERCVPFLLGKQAVHSIVWNQLRDDVPHDFAHGGLFDAEGVRKPAMESLADIRRNYLS